MERIKNFLGRRDESFDPIKHGYTQGLLNSLNPMPANEEQMMKDLEINIHTIKDDGETRRLEQLSVTPEYDLKIKIPDGQGNLKEETIHYGPQPVPWALAARFAISPVNSTRFLTKEQAKIYKNRQRAEFLKIKRGMRRADREVFGYALNQLELQALQATDDCVGGQKMLAMKTSGRNVRVGVDTVREGK